MTTAYTIRAYREHVNAVLDMLQEEKEEEQVILVGQTVPGQDFHLSAPSGKDYKRINSSDWAKDAFAAENDVRDLRDGNTFFMHTLILPRQHLSELAEDNIVKPSSEENDEGGDDQ